MMASKKLIINADDFGGTPEINQAIIDLIEAGWITSASILVKEEWTGSKGALAFARDYEGKASYGLHLDLSSWFRFSDFQFWGRDENHIIHNYRNIFAQYRQIILDDIHRQFSRFTKLGGEIAHLDGHHHVHHFPEILHEVVPIMQEYDVNKMRFTPGFYLSAKKLVAVELFLSENGILTPDHFIAGVPDNENGFLQEGVNEAMIHVFFGTTGGKTEYGRLMTEPCYSEAELISYKELT